MKRLFEKISHEEIEEKSYIQKINPQVGIQKNQKKFTFAWTAQDYLNFPESSVYLKFQIQTQAGAALAEADKVSVINCIGNTFCRQMNISMQGKPLINHNHVDYISYFEQQLSHNESTAKSWCQSHLMYQDRHDVMDTLSDVNPGWKMRSGFVAQSKLCETIARPPIFPFTCKPGKYFPPGVDYKIEITRNEDDFLLLCSQDKQYKIVIQDIYLQIRHVRINDLEAAMAQEQFLAGAVASYAFSQVGFETFHVARGQTAIKFYHNKNMTLRPKILIMTLISETAYNGARHLNPFAFKHYGLTRADISVENEAVWPDGLQFDWDNGLYLHGFHQMNDVLGYNNSDDGLDITRNGWDQSFFCVCADLSTTSQRNKTGAGNSVTVEFKFNKPLTENIRVLCYSTYHNVCTIEQPIMPGTKQRTMAKIVKIDENIVT